MRDQMQQNRGFYFDTYLTMQQPKPRISKFMRAAFQLNTSKDKAEFGSDAPHIDFEAYESLNEWAFGRVIKIFNSLADFIPCQEKIPL